MATRSELARLNQKPVQGLSVDFDPAKALTITIRNIFVVILIIISSGLLGYLYLRYTKPVYEGRSLIQLQLKSSSSLLGLGENGSGVNDGVDVINLSTELSLIRSDVVIEELIDSLGLTHRFFTQGELLNDERYQSSPFRINYQGIWPRGKLDQPILFSVLDSASYINKDNGVTYRFGEDVQLTDHFVYSITRQANSGYIGDFMYVESSKEKLKKEINSTLVIGVQNADAKTISISLRESNRSKVNDILHVLNAIYIRKTVENKTFMFRNSIDYIKEQIHVVQDSLEHYERMLQRYNLHNLDRHVDEYQENKDVLKELDELQNLIVDGQLELSDISNISQLIKQPNDSTFKILGVLSSFAKDQSLKQKIDQLAITRDRTVVVAGAYGPESSTRQAQEELYAHKLDDVDEMLMLYMEKLQVSLDRLKDKADQVRSKLVSVQVIDPFFRQLIRKHEVYNRI